MTLDNEEIIKIAAKLYKDYGTEADANDMDNVVYEYYSNSNSFIPTHEIARIWNHYSLIVNNVNDAIHQWSQKLYRIYGDSKLNDTDLYQLLENKTIECKYVKDFTLNFIDCDKIVDEYKLICKDKIEYVSANQLDNSSYQKVLSPNEEIPQSVYENKIPSVFNEVSTCWPFLLFIFTSLFWALGHMLSIFSPYRYNYRTKAIFLNDIISFFKIECFTTIVPIIIITICVKKLRHDLFFRSNISVFKKVSLHIINVLCGILVFVCLMGGTFICYETTTYISEYLFITIPIIFITYIFPILILIHFLMSLRYRTIKKITL